MIYAILYFSIALLAIGHDANECMLWKKKFDFWLGLTAALLWPWVCAMTAWAAIAKTRYYPDLTDDWN